MESPGILLLAGFVLLYVGGESLVRGAESLALRLGLTPLVVGLTVVAFATSSPELMVSIQAVLSGHSDVAIGNVVGSNICNIGLVLGLAALMKPVKTQIQLVKFDVPILLFCASVLLYMLGDGIISRAEGGVLFAGIIIYVAFSLWQARREVKITMDTVSEELPVTTSSLPLALILIVFGVAALVFGGDFFVEGAIAIARFLDLSEAVIGLTLVALGTSLPELAATVVATAKGKADLAVGNAIGSCVFNLLAILGITALLSPLEQGNIQTLDLVVMLAFMVLLLPLLFSRLNLSRGEGALMVFCYALYTAWLVV